MPPAYEILLLNTAVPQIQAAQAGDTYVVPRDIAFSAALTLSAGTANGVPYLNASKVLTTGSALTFDGTNFGIGGSASFKLDVISSSDVAGAIRSTGSSNSASLILSNGNGTTSANYSYIRYFNNSASPQEWRVGTYGDARFVWQNITAGSEAMCLTSTGLGIGTSSPATKLHVNTATAGYGITVAASSQTSITYQLGIDSNSNLAFYDTNAAAQRMVLSNSGNLGLGVTPSAWGSALKSFENQGGAVTSTSAGNLRLYQNAYQNAAGQQIYRNSLVASLYAQDAGQHIWFTAPSGTAGDPISFTQAMTLDASGLLTVGNTSPAGSSQITAYGASNGQIAVQNSTNWSRLLQNSGDLYIDNGVGGVAGNIIFRNSSSTTERARITSGGYFKASDAGTYANSTGTYHELRQTANAQTVVVSATNASYTSESISSLVTKTAGTDWLHFYGTSDANTVANIKIFGNGNIQNANGSYGTISDHRLKQDIVDASSQWNDIKAIRFRKYRMKTDVAANPDAPYLLGVIAQELEQTSPGLVEETEDKIDGGTVKSVKTSVLLMKAAVALQEAMARIETLEAEVAALKGN